MSARARSYLPILAALVLTAMAVPGTALAKGPGDAQVDGPGLATPLQLDWDADEGALAALIDASGFWGLAEPAAANAPDGELGARYVITYTVHDDQGAAAVLALHAYPYAQPRPLVYAPAGQVWPMGAVPEGWRRASTALTAWFDGQVDATAVAAPEPAATPAAAVAAPGDRGQWVLVPVGAAVLLAAGLLIVTTRRRVRGGALVAAGSS